MSILKRLTAPASLITAFAVGLSFPVLSVAQPLVRPLVMCMLFMVFLQMNWGHLRLRISNFSILLANFCIPLSFFAILYALGYPILALGAFLAGIAPTGTAAPSVISFLRQNVEYGVTSFVLTTFGITIAIPFILPHLITTSKQVQFWDIFTPIAVSTCTLVFIPVILSLILRGLIPASQNMFPRFYRATSFGLWVCCITIMLGGASNTIHQSVAPSQHWFVPACFCVALAVCVTNFSLGFFLSKKYPHEASQTLGQKNISVSVVLAQMFCDPLTTIVPLMYILCHNSWNSYQMIRLGIKDSRLEQEEGKK